MCQALRNVFAFLVLYGLKHFPILNKKFQFKLLQRNHHENNA